MSISASLVKELRERTSAGLMDCKKALKACEGDIEQAVDYLRKSGQAKADKRAAKLTAEGVILLAVSADKHQVCLLEVNCETDFVARDEQFKAFCQMVVAATESEQFADSAALLAHKHADGRSLEEVRCELVAKIGENIQIRRMLHIKSEHTLGIYQHGERIGACVALAQENPELAKDLAMQVAATAPKAIQADDVPADLVAKEREIYITQAKQSGKPEAIIEKIVAGQVAKFVNAQTLVGQSFIKNPEQKVADLLAEHKNQVQAFIRLEVGEGVEKEEQDFAAEVQAQIKASGDA